MKMCSSQRLIFSFLVCVSIQVPVWSVENGIANTLCGMRTDELIRYYGYKSEVHNVTTDDGYILTIFRCNSHTAMPKNKSVILQHGLLISSDDFCINPPNQSLAYVLADAGYDVWLPNSRGNVYSRNHLTRDPDSKTSGFWDFSWYEMGIYDQPAVIDYVLEETNNTKTYYVGFSQGTTSLMILLSEKPKYNDKIQLASLMAPVGYMDHVGLMYRLASPMAMLLESFKRLEIFGRNRRLNDMINSICGMNMNICKMVIDIICGPSDSQRNNAILPAFICHVPSGASIEQLLHYAQEINLGFFGKYMKDRKVPSDFALSRITAPMSLHYSTADKLADAADVIRLIPKLVNSVVSIQSIDEPKFNHIDFLWSKNAVSVVYSEILKLFDKFQ